MVKRSVLLQENGDFLKIYRFADEGGRPIEVVRRLTAAILDFNTCFQAFLDRRRKTGYKRSMPAETGQVIAVISTR